MVHRLGNISDFVESETELIAPRGISPFFIKVSVL